MDHKRVESEKIFEHMVRKFELDLELDVPDGEDFTHVSYLVLFQEILLKFACNYSLNRSTLRVFMFLIGKMDYGNKINYSQVQIAEELGMQPSLVSKSIKLLVTNHVIIYSKRERLFYLNPKLGWRGPLDDYNEFIHKRKYEQKERGEFVDAKEKEFDRRHKEREEQQKRRKESEEIII